MGLATSSTLRRFLFTAAAFAPLAGVAIAQQGNRGGAPPVDVKPSYGAMREDRGTEATSPTC
jgi:hypothetical protein